LGGAVAKRRERGRASRGNAKESDIPDFPKPIKVGRQLYWKKIELDALEAALLRFEGRCVFDRKRKHEKRVKALTKTRSAGATRKPPARVVQQDLFS